MVRQGFRGLLAGKSAIQINEMQAACALAQPVASLFGGAIGKNSGLFHQALLQTDALPVLEINCRNNQHGSLGE